MNALLSLVTALHLATATASSSPAPAASTAGERYLAAEGIVVSSVAAIPGGVDDAVWNTAPAARVPVAPQVAIALNDSDANAQKKAEAPGAIVVRAVASASDVAVLVEWSDATETRFDGETDSFGDSVAIEIPVSFGAGRRLPYIGMGDAGAPVLLHMARASANGEVVVRDIVAAGFGSGVRASGIAWRKAALAYRAKERVWRALFVRPIVTREHRLDAALVPIAFAVWDGARDQRGGNKLLSSWHVLRMPGRAVDAAYLDELAFGYHDGDVGDASRGRGFVEAVCVSCHRIGEKAFAPVDLAPELTNVGVLSTYGYLRDSLLAPSLVLVPNLNKNRHQARGGARDPHGAYASGTLGTFAVVDATGTPQSLMPAFATLPREQLADVIAYLKTLGTPSGAAATRGATP
jgi:complex iron-sulfur molybdoenzyme family reductase subunit gamma